MDDRMTWATLAACLVAKETPDERARLERWLSESPEHRARYAELQRVWALTEPSPHADADLESGWARIEGEIRTSRRSLLRVVPARRGLSVGVRWGLAGAAAAMAVLVGRPRSSPVAAPLSTTSWATSAGERATIRLPDGSMVLLAPESRLRARAWLDRRDVELTGQGWFAVAADSSRPFTVAARNAVVTVRGTRFAVAEDPEGPGPTLVAVAEGTVAVGNGSVNREVGPGQAAAADSAGVRSVPTGNLLDWVGGEVSAVRVPLGRAARELSRWYGRPLRLGRADSSTRVTYRFTSETAYEAFNLVARLVGARLRAESAGFVLDHP